MLGEKLLGPSGPICTKEALRGASAVGLYFSASWCPPCRGFTPTLIDSYNKSLESKGFRCILVSSDRGEEAFNEYFAKMPWLALPYSDRTRQEELSRQFQVQSIPTLALVDSEGQTITTGARNSVVEDPEGNSFPWRPPLVRDLAHSDPGRLNELPSIVCLCDSADESQQRQAFDDLLSVAQDWIPSRGPEKSYAYFVASSGGLTNKVRSLCGLQATDAPQLVLIDVPDNGGFYLGAGGNDALDKDAMRKLLKDYEDNTLERKQLSS